MISLYLLSLSLSLSLSPSLIKDGDTVPDDSLHSHRPIQIVTAHMDHKFELNIETLEEILLSNEVKDKPVVVLTVAGAFRKGKSFLLDFLLRFLDNTVCYWVGRALFLMMLHLIII